MQCLVAFDAEQDAFVNFIELVPADGPANKIVIVVTFFRWINMVELEHAANGAPPFDHFLNGFAAMAAAIAFVKVKQRAILHNCARENSAERRGKGRRGKGTF